MKRRYLISASLACVMIAGCAAQSGESATASAEAAPAAAPVFIRSTMQNDVNPAIMAIWDVTNNVYTDAGEQDPSLITEAGWAALNENAAKLARYGDAMANAGTIHSAAPGNMEVGEYEVTMEDVQTLIDRAEPAFRAMSANFATLARNLEAAAQAKDGTTAIDAAGQIDEACAACHAIYWYGEV